LPTALKQAYKQQKQKQQQKQADPPAAAAPAAAAAVSDTAALSAAVSALGLEGDFGAELAQLLAAEDIPEVQEVDPEQQQQPQRGFVGRSGAKPQAARARKSPAEIAKAAAARRAARQRVSEKYLQSSAQALVKRAEREMADADEFEDVTDDDVIDAEATTLTQQQQGGEGGPAAAAGADDDDDLDWQALAQYEELEKYIGDVKQQQQAPGRKPAAAAAAANKVQVPAALSAAAAAEALKEEQEQQAAAPGPAAAQAAAPAAPPQQSSSSSSSLAPPKQPPQQQQQPSPVMASGKKGSKSKRAKQVAMFEKDLDELERFVNMFETMQASSSSSRQQLAQKPSLPGGGSSSTAAAAADPEAAGEAFLAALLGHDWEAELLDDLAAVIDEGEEEQQQAKQQQQQQQQARQLPQSAAGNGSSAASPAAAAVGVVSGQVDEEEDEDPWMDDITALLLGLVSISHQKYLGAPMPLPGLEAVTEEQRCGAFWSAPFSLLVLDDTAGNCVEYVNEGGVKALGRGYLDLFGQPAVELVHQGLESQVRGSGSCFILLCAHPGWVIDSDFRLCAFKAAGCCPALPL
jgi:hypothetical protein